VPGVVIRVTNNSSAAVFGHANGPLDRWDLVLMRLDRGAWAPLVWLVSARGCLLAEAWREDLGYGGGEAVRVEG
jgi:hypothetical protein